MKESEEYFFNDFTESNYIKLLELAKTQYKNFVFFNETNDFENFVIWRHDVDISMHRALALAKIEARKGIKSTFFVLITSENYSLFEKDIRNILIEISELGHSIGLHFDANYYDISNKEDLEKYLTSEKTILENIINKNIDVFSFHVPIANKFDIDDYILAGMINVYSSHFKDIDYTSDSGGIWRHRRLQEVLEKKDNNKLQVLTHPVWWQKEIMSPRMRVERSFKGRINQMAKIYDQHLLDNDRENIGLEEIN